MKWDIDSNSQLQNFQINSLNEKKDFNALKTLISYSFNESEIGTGLHLVALILLIQNFSTSSLDNYTY